MTHWSCTNNFDRCIEESFWRKKFTKIVGGVSTFFLQIFKNMNQWNWKPLKNSKTLVTCFKSMCEKRHLRIRVFIREHKIISCSSYDIRAGDSEEAGAACHAPPSSTLKSISPALDIIDISCKCKIIFGSKNYLFVKTKVSKCKVKVFMGLFNRIELSILDQKKIISRTNTCKFSFFLLLWKNTSLPKQLTKMFYKIVVRHLWLKILINNCEEAYFLASKLYAIGLQLY